MAPGPPFGMEPQLSVLDFALIIRSTADPTSALKELLTTRDYLTTKSHLASDHRQGLKFSFPPEHNSPSAASYPPEDHSPSQVNTGRFSLYVNAPENAFLLSYEEWLLETLERVEILEQDEDSETKLQSKALTAVLEIAFKQVEAWKAEEWDRQRIDCVMAATEVGMDGKEMRRVHTGT